MSINRPYRGQVHAPDFPPNAEWFNTGRPLSLEALRGKLVLLDFWTYGCINCIHVIPDLKRLEEDYPEELVVIGVHSAKFENERTAENLRRVILRYNLEHPIVSDPDFDIWRQYAVRAWPTTVLIGPNGNVLVRHSGEGVYEAYGDLIADMIEDFDERGLLDRRPLNLVLEQARVARTALSFPGKVLADEAGGRLFISDSNNHRVVVTGMDGQVQTVIGSGAAALQDGSFDEAAFNKPQGMALDGDTLYVADTENHAVRAVDLARQKVQTLAGDGQLAYRQPVLPASQARLNSPWDLVLVGRRLYIAMAGTHQLWVYNMESGMIGPYAGNGAEALVDGPLMNASLNQPSGITTDGERLYFADSEASAVRSADLEARVGAEARVRTIIGEGLFEFGDVDGAPPTARMQHPLGIEWYRGTLYVADTYNHKIKVVDPDQPAVTTLLGTGEPGWENEPSPHFYEPGGLSAAAGKLYIADTNNHVIRIADLDDGTVSTLAVSDPEGMLGRGMPVQEEEPARRLPEQVVRPGPVTLQIEIDLPEGYHVNEAAPSLLAWESVPGFIRLAQEMPNVDLRREDRPIEVALDLPEGQGTLVADLSLYYCRSEESACLIQMERLELPLQVKEGAEGTAIKLPIQVAQTEI